MTENQENDRITFEDILTGYDNPAWLGWGYLGERKTHLEDHRFAFWADKLAVDLANEHHMTHEQFFHWLNSRQGRLFADTVFGSLDKARAEEEARRWHMVRIPSDHRLQHLLAV
jgi:hypothetical protein